jgi:hypothetical protein
LAIRPEPEVHLLSASRRSWALPRLIAASAATLLLTACGSGSSVNPKEIGPCPPGREITGRQLRGALRQQGFSVACLRGVYGTRLANFSPTGQGNRAALEGAVACDATKYMPPRTEHHPHKIYEWGHAIGRSGPGRELMPANIDCTLYLYSDTRSDADGRIRAAFRTLAAGQY